VNRHESAAAKIAAAGMRHGQRVSHGNGRVDGISALAQNRGAHIGGQCCAVTTMPSADSKAAGAAGMRGRESADSAAVRAMDENLAA